MQKLLYPLLLLLGTMSYGQDFYDMNTVQNIEITFAESNWDQLLDNEKSGNGDYILAQSVSINGEVFDSVGVKYKGNSTYNPNQAKNPFHIELDTYKDHQYGDYTDIKLSNVAKDPSFLREVLSYQVLRQYMDAPLSNYANVSVNGSLIGLYSNSESVSKKFVNSRFGSKKNTFVKCNPPGGAGPGSNDFPNLVYMGQDSTVYYDSYEIKSDFGWLELIDLCDTLANQTDAIEDILDVDRALWMIAFNNVLVNLDSYSGGFTQNYYLYRDDYGRFLPIVWDLNESFGKFSMSGSGNLNSTASKQQMDHLLHNNDSDFPLIQKILAVPTYKRMYLAHIKTMVLENFDNGTYFSTGQALQTLIDADVQADNNKFFSYSNFLDNLESDISGGGGGPGGGGTPGIANLMDGRAEYLLGLSDFTAPEPTITNISLSSNTPVIGDLITVTANVTDAQLITLRYRSETGAPFAQIEMFDDGAHNDENANDGIYGADIDLSSTITQYYIYAENDIIGKFSPARAQHEYYQIAANSTNTQIGDLVINEFMASNDATVSDQNEEFDDWIELYNNGSTSIDISGYFLSDNPDNTSKWIFPENTVIGSNEYLTVWADNDEEQDGLHASFKLSATAESVVLSDTDTIVIDEVSYLEQSTDISYGRFPNGTGVFREMTPTFGSENVGTTSNVNLTIDQATVKVFPNPTKEEITILSAVEINSISIFDLTGQNILNHELNDNQANIDLRQFSPGIYLFRILTKDNKVEHHKIIIE